MTKFSVDELTKIKEFIYFQINNLSIFKKSKLVCDLFPKESIGSSLEIVMFNEKNREYYLDSRVDDSLLKKNFCEALNYRISKLEEKKEKKSFFNIKKEYFFKLDFGYMDKNGDYLYLANNYDEEFLLIDKLNHVLEITKYVLKNYNPKKKLNRKKIDYITEKYSLYQVRVEGYKDY